MPGILNESKLIGPNIGDLPHALAQRLVDSNAKIAQTALAICQQLADAMGPPCRQYVRAFFPGFLNGLGDGKQFIRAASITCMNVWGDQCGYKEFFEAEMIADALRNGSPALRAELLCWLAEKMPPLQPRTLSKDELMACLPHLYTNLCDRTADVRKHANDAVYGFMLHLGYETMLKGVEKVKPSSKKDIQAVLDKTRPNLPVKPLPKGRQQAPLLDEMPRAASAVAKSAASAAGPNKIQKAASGAKINAQGASTAAAAAASKKDEEVDMSPLLLVNNLKNQRMLDEQKLKVLKWNFTTPREEFIDLLRDQMQAANINKGLMANMFHADFRYHLKAIDMLLDDLPANSKALICNLDLVLKWVSLRFYDTNPSVLLKGLDYLHLVFDMLCENHYDLAEAEGSCFIPHLLIKVSWGKCVFYWCCTAPTANFHLISDWRPQRHCAQRCPPDHSPDLLGLSVHQGVRLHNGRPQVEERPPANRVLGRAGLADRALRHQCVSAVAGHRPERGGQAHRRSRQLGAQCGTELHRAGALPDWRACAEDDRQPERQGHVDAGGAHQAGDACQTGGGWTGRGVRESARHERSGVGELAQSAKIGT